MPLSSSWGQHSCTYVAGAAAAIAAAAVSPQLCRGRCFLQDDGTLDISRFQDTSNATIVSFDVTNDLANLTSLPPPSVADVTIPPTAGPTVPSEINSTTIVLGNTTIPSDPPNNEVPSSTNNSSTPSSDSETDPPSSNDPNIPADNSTTNSSDPNPPIQEINGIPTVSNNTNDVSYANTTLPTAGDGDLTFNQTNDDGDSDSAPYSSSSSSNNSSTPPPEYAIFNDTAPDDSAPLNCPCNCTYVSAACCLSQNGIVYEDPSMQIPMDPLPGNATICCNERTGHWIWKSSGECSSAVLNGNASDFIGLGHRKWNSTFSNALGFPDDDANT